MLPEFEAIVRTAAVAFGLLVPGASAAAGFEWHSVRYGRRRKDWVLRLLLFSGLWLAAGFWLWHWVSMNHWDDLIARKPVPWYVYMVPVGFVVVPYVVGWAVGWLTRRHPGRMARFLGANRTPTAWDHLFSHPEAAPLLRDGEPAWTGGGILLRWDEIESLEFIPEPPDEAEDNNSDERKRKRRRRRTRKGPAAQSR